MHRVFISHALPSFLAQVAPLEAVEYVLPLLPSLAMDEGACFLCLTRGGGSTLTE